MKGTTPFELLLVGGGLQSALIALSILRRHPDARLAILEKAPVTGGNHTWSFHAQDLSEEMSAVVAPLLLQRWPRYEVAFPGLSRSFEQPYSSISSERLAEVLEHTVRRAPNARLLLETEVIGIEADGVVLASGERLAGGYVVDARGPQRGGTEERGPRAYQKFVGLEVELAGAPRPLTPCLMDARVAQLDGYRFVYTLPVTRDRCLIEDTYYSDSPELDEVAITRRIHEYVIEKGLGISRVLRTERGVLPLPLSFTPLGRTGSPLVAGYGGGFFHPTTGYSLPAAARVAELLASCFPSFPPASALEALRRAHDTQARFFTVLNRLLFRACAPEDRWRLLERFHRLPEGTVARFYALSTTRADRARILLGRPPRGISFGRALAELAGGAR